jgi:circadian clock protein KaiC
MPNRFHPPERMLTGVAGLDDVSLGGLPKGGLNLILGAAGTGKSVLTTQIAFHHARQGGVVLYITLLAESNDRLLSNMSTFEFFDPAAVGTSIVFLGGFPILESEGLEGLRKMITTGIAERNATLLVLDGLEIAEGFAPSVNAYKKWIHQISSMTSMAGCTALGIGTFDEVSPHPERSIVEGLLVCHNKPIDRRMVREIEILKMRGVKYMEGRHVFQIGSGGLRIFPRFAQSIGPAVPHPRSEGVKVSTGIKSLDTMLGGGVPKGSSTLVLGAPGTGKTLIALHFLQEGQQQGEVCLYAGSSESPELLQSKAEKVGINLDISARQLHLFWHPASEVLSEVLLHELLLEIDRTGAKRVALDGLDVFLLGAASVEQLPVQIGTFLVALESRGVTCIITSELAELFAEDIRPTVSIAGLFDNLFILRYVEYRAQLRRSLSVLKVRQGPYDNRIREFVVSSEGIELVASFEGAESLMSGSARGDESR